MPRRKSDPIPEEVVPVAEAPVIADAGPLDSGSTEPAVDDLPAEDPAPAPVDVAHQDNDPAPPEAAAESTPAEVPALPAPDDDGDEARPTDLARALADIPALVAGYHAIVAGMEVITTGEWRLANGDREVLRDIRGEILASVFPTGRGVYSARVYGLDRPKPDGSRAEAQAWAMARLEGYGVRVCART